MRKLGCRSGHSPSPRRLMYTRRCRVLGVYIRKEQAPAEYPLTRLELIHAPGSLCSTTTCRSHSRGVRGYRGHHHGSHGRSMHDAACELRRITIPRTSVNKGKKEGPGCSLLLGGATYNNAGTWERLGEEAECESWGNFY